MASFFIHRPVFAWVLAIIVMLAGILSILNLPVAQFPKVAPPSVVINATYPGASAQTLEDTVTQVIEQKMTGLDNLIYMQSTSDNSGRVQINLSFASGTNGDIAQVQVQNKLQLAIPLLPAEVQKQGISVAKSSDTFIKIFSFISKDKRLSEAELADFVGSTLLDQVSRIEGVGEATLFGSQNAMRIWLDPRKLHNYNMMPSDVIAAINSQNAQISAGQLGGMPAAKGQRINLAIAVQERLTTPEQFGAIILRTLADGSMVRVRDVARVEIGSENYSFSGSFMGQPSASMAIKLATGANALDTAARVDAYLQNARAYFPAGVDVVSPYDTSPFVSLSIHEVIKTLFEAVVLVVAIMYLFLQNFRATLIPTIAVPVVLLGTFGVLAALGYSINTLTMFGMVLAIGLLVDDAIVVVENVERVMHEEKLDAVRATEKSMQQISGALVGIALVLAAVFVPMAFMGGSVGVIYRQFSVTIVSAMTLSVLVALILTPALCAAILKPRPEGEQVQHGFFGWFNRMFERSVKNYQNSVKNILRRGGRCMVIYLLLLAGLGVMIYTLPSGFLPEEDQGILAGMVQLPAGATLEETEAVVREVEEYLRTDEKDAIDNFMSILGFSFSGRGQNNAMIFITLKPWHLRESHDLKAQAVAGRAMQRFASLAKARVFMFTPPAILELGNATGFDLQLQDQGGLGHTALLNARNQLLAMAAQDRRLVAVRPNGMEDQPQLRVQIDREKAGALGLNLDVVNNALGIIWGSAYADDFLDRGRVKKVYVQGDTPFRMQPEDMEHWFFRNDQGAMVPFSAFATSTWEYAPTRLERYNGVPSMEIMGEPAPGVSSGEAMAIMEELAARLPEGISYSWTALSYQEKLSGAQAPALYALSILVVFLCLAALYESWSVPFAVILVVPLGIFGAFLAAKSLGFTNDVYFQVGLLATIGLSAKNAILIVEFAKEMHDRGIALGRACVTAARMRLRPILMTSLAFLLGILPMALSNGAGSGGQNALGTGVLGGTFTATVLGIFFIPLFFAMVTVFFAKLKGKSHMRTPNANITKELRP